MDLKFLGFVILLGLLVLIGVASFVRNFVGLLKIEKPTKKEISYNEGIAVLTATLFMLWIILLEVAFH